MEIEAYLEDQQFVRGLASSLLFDEHKVDDVVQETWVRALQARQGSVRSIRPWLGTIVRNLVVDKHRRAKRLEKRELAAAREEALPSAAAIVERESIRREVVEAALELREPYRAVILLRYFEELTPKQIAARLNEPVGTIHSRLKRGLTMLREKLDETHGGDRRSWCLGLIPLALPKAKVAASIVSSAAVAAFLLLGFGGWFWFHSNPTQVETAVATTKNEATLVLKTDDQKVLSVPKVEKNESERARVKASSSTPDSQPDAKIVEANPNQDEVVGTAELRVQIIDQQTRLPIPQAKIMLFGGTAGAENSQMFLPHSLTADDNGVCLVSSLSKGIYYLVAAPQANHDGVALPKVITVDMHWADFLKENQITDAFYKNAAKELNIDTSHLPSLGELPEVYLPLHSKTELIFELPQTTVKGGTLLGEVRGADGELVLNAEIAMLPVEAQKSMGNMAGSTAKLAESLPIFEKSFGNFFQRTASDSSGQFRFAGITGKQWLLIRASGYFMTEAHAELYEGESSRISIVLKPVQQKWTISGRVLDEEGKPIPNAIVFVGAESDEITAQTLEQDVEVFLNERQRPSVRSDADGRFLFKNISGLAEAGWVSENTRHRIEVSAHSENYCSGFLDSMPIPTQPIEDLEIVLKPSRNVEVQVIDAITKKPVQGAEVEWNCMDVGFFRLPQEFKTNSEGKLSLSKVPTKTLYLNTAAKGFMEKNTKLPADPISKASSVVIELERYKAELGIRGKIITPEGKPIPRYLMDPSQSTTLIYFQITASEKEPTQFLKKDPNTGKILDSGFFDRAHGEIKPDGSFQLIPLKTWTSSECWVVLEAAGVAPQIKKVQIGESNLQFTLDPKEISGNVSWLAVEVQMEAGSESFGSPQFKLFRQESSREMEWEHSSNYYQKPHTEVGYVESSGVFDLVVHKNGNGMAIVRGIELSPGKEPKRVVVKLSGESKIRGQIPKNTSTAKGKNSGVYVNVYDLSGRNLAYTKAQAGAAFLIEGLCAGEYRVEYQSLDNWSETFVAEVKLEPGQEVEAVFTMKPRERR